MVYDTFSIVFPNNFRLWILTCSAVLLLYVSLQTINLLGNDRLHNSIHLFCAVTQNCWLDECNVWSSGSIVNYSYLSICCRSSYHVVLRTMLVLCSVHFIIRGHFYSNVIRFFERSLLVDSFSSFPENKLDIKAIQIKPSEKIALHSERFPF